MKIISEINKEIVITHTATLSRLLKLKKEGSDAFTLYNFYSWVASWQLTNKVKANDIFCMNGLHWGRIRFRKAKDILIKENLIEKITRKDKQGKIKGHYIHIHFLNGFTTRAKNHPVVKPTSGKQTTNAYNKKESTLDKKENALYVGKADSTPFSFN